MQRLADIVSAFQSQLTALSPQQRKVCQQIRRCRTPALGGFQLECSDCGARYRLYHACRNRHCPRCQQQASEQWLQRELSQVVDTHYFHLVFTLPHAVNGWVRLHPRVIYNSLFRSVWDTLNTLGHDPKRLNGQLAMTAVLHTWGQNLSQHVHLHCLIPGGAISENHHWHPAKSSYLFPVRVLSRLFRGKMIRYLREAAQQQQLNRITHPGEVNRTLNQLMQTDWVVYAKPGLQQATTVVRYLARYTRKIAISESRLLQCNQESVRFSYQDYRDGQQKVMTLSGSEFLRRFLQHVLPHGFMRIRHYGWLANACRNQQLPRVRQAIATDRHPTGNTDTKEKPNSEHGFDGIPCPCCQQAIMCIRYTLLPQQVEYG